MEYIRRILDEIGIGAERVGVSQGGNLTLEQIKSIIEKRVEAVESLGPNPMKRN